MSFREKSAWITLIALIALTGPFVVHLPFDEMLAPTGNEYLFRILLWAIALFIGVEILAHIVVAIFSPRDAMAPRDERDRLIALKSRALAAYVYILLSLLSIMTIHHGANRYGIAILVFLSFIIAEIVNYAARIVFYRRGT